MRGLLAAFGADLSASQIWEPYAQAYLEKIGVEALTNIARHAEASEVHLQIVRDGRRLGLQIRDDGLGFPFADAEFTLTYHGDASFEASVAVDGATLPDWRFRGETLNGHVCVSARGPITDIVDGEGVFGFTFPDGSQAELLMERGEYINVPKDTEHWFHLTRAMRIKAVRYFSGTDGWVPVYTGADVRVEPLL